MDMSPPQAPPAITRLANQTAVDAEQRLAHARLWLAGQHAALLALPAEPSEPGRADFQARLASFWSPVGEPALRYGEQLAAVMNADITLQREHGTLSEAAARMARSIVHAGPASVTTAQAYELLIGGTPLANSLVVTTPDHGGMALRFTGASGWESFDSLGALLDATDRDIRARLASGVAPAGIMPDEAETAVMQPSPVSMVRIEGPVFEALSRRAMLLMAERADDAWTGIDPAAPRQDRALTTLADRLTAALDPHLDLDIDAMRMTHAVRRVQAANDRRLARVPASAARAWRAASGNYLHALYQAGNGGANAAASLQTVRAFASARLKAQLTALGIAEAPESIMIRLHALPDFGTPAYRALATGIEPADATPATPATQMSLLDLALKNVGLFDRKACFAYTSDGRPLGSAFSHAVIRRTVRQADVAATYREHLLGALLNSPEGQQARTLSASVRNARMRFDLVDAQLSEYLADEDSAFVDDRAQRGYHWVSAVLANPAAAGRQTVEGHALAVSQVTYKGSPVADVLVIGTTAPASVPSVVLYTPDAPDGHTFREFADREEAARAFFYAPAFETYLLDRLPADVATTTLHGDRHFRVDEGRSQAAWVFGQDEGNYTRTDEPFAEQVITGDAMLALYDTGVSLLSRNLASVARSTAHADADNVSPDIDPDAVARGVAAFIGRPFAAGWRSYDHIKAGEHALAFVALTEAYTSAVDLYALGQLRPLLWRSAPARLGRTARATEAQLTHPPSGAPLAVFESRYVAADVRASHARVGHDGIYRINGQTYIAEGETLYAVRFDASADTWRLTRPGAPDALFSGPAVIRSPSGRWQFNREVGLRGGREPLLKDAVDRALPQYTPYQRRAVAADLAAGAGDDATTIAGIMAQPETWRTPLSEAQAAHWARAVARGQRTPQVRPRTPPAAGVPAPAAVERLAPDAWPAQVWCYVERADDLDSPVLFLAQQRSRFGRLNGISASSVNPAVLGRQAPAPGAWVRIDMAELRARITADGTGEITVWRVPDTRGFGYVLQPAATPNDPRATGALWLGPGDFTP